MAISAAMIKELRERTGAGMMDCKKVLTEVDGDMELAIEELRKRGAAAAEKKAGRIAAEGIVVTAQNESASAMVEINCETDFVAKDESFKVFSGVVANAALTSDATDVEGLGAVSIDGGATVEEARQELIVKIGENISVRRFVKMAADGDTVSSYLHGARIGVLVKLAGGNNEIGRDIAMHIAASSPLCISEADMDSAVVQKEKEIFVAQAEESGKTAEIIEKMVGGRIKKFLKENTLLGQPFVKNPDQTVGELLVNAGASMVAMTRFEVGEGLEKRSEDFVAEVMAQVGS
jgi:elongation factor Ts